MKHQRQQPKRRARARRSHQQLRPGVPLITRATSFILEHNRLLQRDNTALIKQLARLREELDAMKPKPEKKPARRAPAAAKVAKAGKR